MPFGLRLIEVAVDHEPVAFVCDEPSGWRPVGPIERDKVLSGQLSDSQYGVGPGTPPRQQSARRKPHVHERSNYRQCRLATSQDRARIANIHVRVHGPELAEAKPEQHRVRDLVAESKDQIELAPLN